MRAHLLRGTMAGMNRRPLLFVAIVAAALVSVTVAFAAPSSRSSTVAIAPLSLVRHEVGAWLARAGFAGFHVDEIMAFRNNDYVAISDPKGKLGRSSSSSRLRRRG